MRKTTKALFATLVVAALAALAALIAAAPAHAQISSTTYVSSGGSDSNGSNGCQRSAPCLSFTTALAHTLDGGNVTCVDSDIHPSLTISISVTIDCSQTTIFALSNNAINVSAPGKNVVLRGLVLRGAASEAGFPGVIGVNITQADTVVIENCKIESMTGGEGIGIKFAPTAGAPKLYVSDTSIIKNGRTGTSAGILIKPNSGISAQVTISHSHIEGNWFGIYADGQSGGTINGLVTDSVVSGNVNNGITVISPASRVALWMDNNKVVNNAFGLRANGAGARMLVRRSIVANNEFGLSIVNGGVLLTYGDNSLNGNTSGDGVFTGLVGLQ